MINIIQRSKNIITAIITKWGELKFIDKKCSFVTFSNQYDDTS